MARMTIPADSGLSDRQATRVARRAMSLAREHGLSVGRLYYGDTSIEGDAVSGEILGRGRAIFGLVPETPVARYRGTAKSVSVELLDYDGNVTRSEVSSLDA